MRLSDLTTVAAVQAWVGSSPSTSADAQMAGLVTAASRMILNYINRPLLTRTSYVELYDGNGRGSMLLRNWPVTSVNSLILNGITVPASPNAPGTSNANPTGYWLEAAQLGTPGQMQSLNVFGYGFPRGRQNVGINYTAGYFISGEAQTVAAGAEKVTVTQPYGPWSSDLGVTYANGTAMTLVTAAPAVGQYQVVADNPGVYLFAAADDAAGVLISYNYVPQDLYQAATELAAERYSYKSRIGKVSAS